MSRTFSPTMRSSMWSTNPTPWRQPISAARSISSTRPRRSPFSATGTPASNSTCTSSGSSGASSGGVISWKTSRRGGSFRSSMTLPSDERPQMLSSIEYGGDSVPPLIGMPFLRAYSISSWRPICQSRTGAMIFSSGASAATVPSIRTWSLPLPVQPWAIVSQPVSRATSTAIFAISGRPSAVNSG